VPNIIVFGILAAAFMNLTVTVVRNRESGIYKRRRATPLPASALIAARALVGVLTALAITVVLLAIGWAAFGASIPTRTAPAFVVDIILGAAIFCCLGFALSTVIGNADAAQPRRASDRAPPLFHLRCVHPRRGAPQLAGQDRRSLSHPPSRQCAPRRLQPAHDGQRFPLAGC
jgi:hypothetical protein